MSERPRRGPLPHPGLSVVLAAMWLLAKESLALADVLLAAALAVAIPLLTRRFWPGAPRLHRPWVLARLLVVFLYDMVRANFTVARLVLGRNDRLRPAFLRVPLELEDDLGLALLAALITLTPGTLSARFSADRRSLLVHGLDVADPAEAVQRIKQRYEAPLREVLGEAPGC